MKMSIPFLSYWMALELLQLFLGKFLFSFLNHFLYGEEMVAQVTTIDFLTLHSRGSKSVISNGVYLRN